MGLSQYRNPKHIDINYSDTHGQLTFVYRNWKGEIKDRRVTPIEIVFKDNDYHDGPQWFLIAYCHDKKAIRDFAIEDILTPMTHVVRHKNRVMHEFNVQASRKSDIMELEHAAKQTANQGAEPKGSLASRR